MDTSNQNLVIATSGTNHVATQTAPDVDRLPPGTPAPFPNFVSSNLNGAGKSANTTIKGQEITLLRTKMGPPSDPGHAGVAKGVKSNTYRKEAQATQGSPDVIVEGDPVVRTGDPTTQNAGNTKGSMVGSSHAASADAQATPKKKKCQIDEFTGEGDGGRMLGWPGKKDDVKDAYYLEVLDDHEVTFKTVRRDITFPEREKNPDCGKPHTFWRATGRKAPSYLLKLDEEKPGVEEWVVPAHWAVDEWMLFMLGHHYVFTETPGDLTNTDGSQDWRGREYGAEDLSDLAKEQRGMPTGKDWGAEHQKRIGRAEMWQDLTLQKPDYDAIQKGINEDRRTEQQEKGRAGRKAWKHDRDSLKDVIAGELGDLLMFWMWTSFAPEIQVEAISCGGSRNATIKVYPTREFKFEWTISQGQREAGFASRQQKRAALRQTIKNMERRGFSPQQIARARELSGVGTSTTRNWDRMDQSAARSKQHQGNKQRQKNLEDQLRKTKRGREALAQRDQQRAKFEKKANVIQMIKSTLETLHTVSKVANQIADYSPGNKLQVKFMYGFGLEWVIQYEPCEAEKPSPHEVKYWNPAKVGRRWDIKFEAEPFFALEGRLVIPLFTFVGGTAGAVAGNIMRKLKVLRADLIFTCTIGFVGAAGFTWNKYWSLVDFYSEIGVQLILGASVRIGVAGVDVIDFTATFTTSGSLKFKGSEDPDEQVIMVPKASFSTHFSLTLFPDGFLIWRPRTVAWAPRSMQHEWNKHETTKWPLLKVSN